MQQASSVFSDPNLALAAIPQLAGNSRQGFGLVASTSCRASSWVISSNTLGLSGSLYDGDVRSRCTGKERDTESGLDYFFARYYTSDLARFMTPDFDDIDEDDPEPVPNADLGNPQSLDLYAYVFNNPNTGIDLDGHVGGGVGSDDVTEEMQEEAADAEGQAESLGIAYNSFGYAADGQSGSSSSDQQELPHPVTTVVVNGGDACSTEECKKEAAEIIGILNNMNAMTGHWYTPKVQQIACNVNCHKPNPRPVVVKPKPKLTPEQKAKMQEEAKRLQHLGNKDLLIGALITAAGGGPEDPFTDSLASSFLVNGGAEQLHGDMLENEADSN